MKTVKLLETKNMKKVTTSDSPIARLNAFSNDLYLFKKN